MYLYFVKSPLNAFCSISYIPMQNPKTHVLLGTASGGPPCLTEQENSGRGLSHVIILEVNKSQSRTKLFIFDSAFPILHKALTKPVWAGFSAQMSNTAHKLIPSLKIPVLLCIGLKWLLGFLLRARRSAPVKICHSSQPPIFIWPRRSSSPVKSLRLAATFLPFQVSFLPYWYSSLAQLTVKFNVVPHVSFTHSHSFQLSMTSCCWVFCLFLNSFPPLSNPCPSCFSLFLSESFFFLLPFLQPGSKCFQLGTSALDNLTSTSFETYWNSYTLSSFATCHWNSP